MFKELKNKMIAENKMKSYFIYALGEIILIVIGILVAMNLGDWKDKNDTISLAKTHIKEIQNDLKKDTAVFGSEIRKIDVIMKYKRMILENDSIQKMSPDDFLSVLTVGYHNIKINANSFNRMKESGVVSLKEYEELFKRINSYYTFYNTYLENRNEWEIGLFEKDVNYWLYQNKVEIYMNDSIPVSQNPLIRKKNLMLMLQSPEGRNVVKMSLLREKTMRDTYKFIIKPANKLLIKIDSLSLK